MTCNLKGPEILYSNGCLSSMKQCDDRIKSNQGFILIAISYKSGVEADNKQAYKLYVKYFLV
jgi:hypothetical protein